MPFEIGMRLGRTRGCLQCTFEGHRGDGTETVIGRSVDLYATARSSLRSSHNRLGLKHLERFYRDTERCTGVADGANSIVAYHQWSTNPDSRRDDTLADIAAYNEDDCRSLRDLRSWLDRLAT